MEREGREVESGKGSEIERGERFSVSFIVSLRYYRSDDKEKKQTQQHSTGE